MAALPNAKDRTLRPMYTGRKEERNYTFFIRNLAKGIHIE